MEEPALPGVVTPSSPQPSTRAPVAASTPAAASNAGGGGTASSHRGSSRRGPGRGHGAGQEALEHSGRQHDTHEVLMDEDNEEEREYPSGLRHRGGAATSTKVADSSPQPRGSVQEAAIRQEGSRFIFDGDHASATMVRDYNKVVTRLRWLAAVQCVCAWLGLLVNVVQRELAYSGGDNSSAEVVLLRFIVSLLTLVLLGSLFVFYQYDFEFAKQDRYFLSKAALWDSERIVSLLVEMLVCVIHEPPYLNVRASIVAAGVSGTAELNNPWGLFMFVRMYLVFRLIQHHYYTGGTKILGLWHNFKFNIPFVVRNVLFSHPFLVLIPVLTLAALIAGYCFNVCERELVGAEPLRDFSSDFGTTMWFVLITMTAVGYGDVYPNTTCGRTVSVMASMTAIVLTAVLVATIYQNLSLLPHEARMVDFLLRVKSRRKLKAVASTAIQASWRYHLAVKYPERYSRAVRMYRHHQMIDAIYAFQTFRAEYQGQSHSSQGSQLFRSMLEEVDDKVTTLVTHFVPEPESDDDSASNAGKPDAGGDAGGEGGGQFITPEAEAIFAVAEELHFLKDHISPGGVSASSEAEYAYTRKIQVLQSELRSSVEDIGVRMDSLETELRDLIQELRQG